MMAEFLKQLVDDRPARRSLGAGGYINNQLVLFGRHRENIISKVEKN